MTVAASTPVPGAADVAGDPAIGVVVIGRNEGERLQRCLRSLGAQVGNAVYVDSGSRDGSVAFARQIGAIVVELDTSIPFTAARARNEGFRALQATGRPVAFVQFVDGDCEVESGWLARAARELRAEAGLAVVFGRRRERAREASPYNRLCDLEWDVPVGEVDSCGGDALMRAEPFALVGGYDPQLIAGEEPDLCLRLRAKGWRIRCIDAPMTIHDAAMLRFGQWWRRSMRSGYVEAEGVARHGFGYPRLRAAVSNLAWTVVLPLLAVGGIVTAFVADGPFAVGGIATAVGVVLLHTLLWCRIAARAARRWQGRDARLYASFCMMSKWPAVHGMLTYAWRRMRRRERRLIEYKQA